MRVTFPGVRMLSMAVAALFAASAIAAGTPARCLLPSHCGGCCDEVPTLRAGSCDAVAPAAPVPLLSEPALQLALAPAPLSATALAILAPPRPSLLASPVVRESGTAPPPDAAPLSLRI